MRENKIAKNKLLAALLWKFLPAKYQKNIITFLDNDEIQSLSDAQLSYSKIDSNYKQQIDTKLVSFFNNKVPLWPLIATGLAFAVGFILYILQILFYQNVGSRIQIEVFSILLIGMISPLMFYFLPYYKRKTLFVLVPKLETITYSFIVYLALIWLLVEINNKEFGAFHLPLFLTFILLLAVVSAPVFEEIIFRELLPSIFGKDPFYFGQLISAFLFAIAHIPDTYEMFFLYFLASALLGILRILSGGLIYGLIVHSISNAVIVLI